MKMKGPIIPLQSSVQRKCALLDRGVASLAVLALCLLCSVEKPAQAQEPEKAVKSGAASFISFDASGAGTSAEQGTLAVNIDTAGDVTGLYVDARGLQHEFFRAADGAISSSAPSDASLPGRRPIFTTSLGSAIKVVAMWRNGSSLSRGFAQPDAECQTLETSRLNRPESAAPNLNETGVATGSCQDANATLWGYVRSSSGAITLFRAPGAGKDAREGTEPFSINTAGEITGELIDAQFASHGFIRSTTGAIVEFDVPGAGTGKHQGSFPITINAAGDVTGYYVDASGARHGFLRIASKVTDGNDGITPFDAPEAETSACSFSAEAGYSPCGTAGLGINASGTVTGGYVDADGVLHGLVRTADGTITPLEAPAAGTGKYQGTISIGINDADSLTGVYAGADSVFHGFLYTPAVSTHAKTSTTLAVSPSSSSYGQAVSFTATVFSSASLPPNGEKVTFMNGSQPLGTATLSGGKAHLTSTALTAGTDSITAAYAGDAKFSASTSKALKMKVNQASSTTTLTSSDNPAGYLQPITFTAAVAGKYGGTATGKVTFSLVGFDQIIALGDSLTEGNEDASGTTYPKTLALLSGQSVKNLGVGGQTSSQIAVRINAYRGRSQQSFSAPFVLPTSGSVAVTFQKGFEPAFRIRSGTRAEISFVAAGTTYTGYVLDNGSQIYNFTPLSYPRAAVSVPAGTAWQMANVPNFVNACVVVWAGRNNYFAHAQIEQDVAAMVAAIQPSTSCYLVMSIPNCEYEPSPSGGYNSILALNQALQATYSAGGHYLDIRAKLVDMYTPANAADLLDHGKEIWPQSLRAGDNNGKITNAISSTTTCAFTSSFPLGEDNIMDIGQEKIFITGGTNGGYACIRGYASTAASTYASGTVYHGVDPLHLGQNQDSAANPNCSNGYICVARQVAEWLRSVYALKSSKYPMAAPQTVTLHGGVAQYTIAGLPVSTGRIAASYSGDENFAASLSNIIVQTINKAITSTTLSSSQNPAVKGQKITFTATVAGVHGGTASGTVTFSYGFPHTALVKVLGSVTLHEGVATFTTTTLPVGVGWITATYDGDTDFAASVSTIVTQVVNK
jgi:hypothetical protein